MRSYAVTTPSEVETLLTVASTVHGPAACHSVHGEAIDRLSDPAQALRFMHAIRRWFGEHAAAEIALRLPEEPLAEADLQQLRCLRSAVRALVDQDRARFDLEFERLRSRHEFTLAVDGQLHATASGWPGFIARLLIPLMAIADRPGRVRICVQPECGWVIFDRSASGTQRHCRTHRAAGRMHLRTRVRRLGMSATR